MGSSKAAVFTNAIRVLIVNEEPALIELTLIGLHNVDSSLCIETTSTPKEALSLHRKHPFDCIISDYQMSEMDGINFLEKLRTFSGVPFIIYTGRGSEEIASIAFSAGVDDYLRKEQSLAHYTILYNRIIKAVEKRRYEVQLNASYEKIHRSEEALLKLNEDLNNSREELRIKNEKLSTLNLELGETNNELVASKLLLQEYSNSLEAKVEERTHELQVSLKRLNEAEKMEALSRLSAMIAHDLRGVMNTIEQSLEAIKRFPERREEILGMVKASTDRAVRMIEDMRSRVKEIDPIKKPVDLGLLISHAIEETRFPDNITSIVKVEDDLSGVMLDSDIIRRVLDNLIGNSIEAMPSGGSLTVEAFREGDEVLVKVSDTGSGIPEEAKPRIWGSFYTTKSDGLGLGLPFCKRAVESHGGTINFQSIEGEGTTFTIRLHT